MASYSDELDGDAKLRYEKKVESIGFDPYKLKKKDWKEDDKLLPDVEYPDVVNYLVLITSYCTLDQVKAYKGMEAYNFFISGWVERPTVKQCPMKDDAVVVFSRVNHSQRLRATATKTWVQCKKNGQVLTSHCDCMAGLSEVCSHVGAVLFLLTQGTRMRKEKTCTDGSNQWLPRLKEVEFKMIHEISFSSAKKQYEEYIKNPPSSATCSAPARVFSWPKPVNVDEQDVFFSGLAKVHPSARILSVTSPYNSSFLPSTKLPAPLTELFDQKYLNDSLEDLQKVAANIDIVITSAEVEAVEYHTREQAKSQVWFSQRAGRITASKLRQALHTKLSKPSRSLLLSICYPKAHSFSTSATKWGCDHEKTAGKQYSKLAEKKHSDFVLKDSGLVISSRWPHLGASPDGVVECTCCGLGTLEVKCPHCHKENDVQGMAQDKKSCLVETDGKIGLDKNHMYYYQVQAQINICDVQYCDFVVWTRKDIHIERIQRDLEFWNDCVQKSHKFFQNAILPELLGRYYSNCSILK